MKRAVAIAAVAVALFAVLLGIEQARADEPFDLLNLVIDVFEMLLLAAAVLLTATFSVETRAMRSERRELIRDLRDATADSERWRAQARSHVDGLSRAIFDQFAVWALTPAEADVAGLLLKGLAHKEIATLRGTGQATVRQHAATIYRKSGLTSRAQITAFFLEDLLAPGRDAPGSGNLHLIGSDRS